MSNLTGYSVKDPNYVLRLVCIVFMGVLAIGSVMFWRSQLLFASEYQEMPVTHQELKVKKENGVKQQKMLAGLQKKLMQDQEEQ
jgi:hypothetical protein